MNAKTMPVIHVKSQNVESRVIRWSHEPRGPAMPIPSELNSASEYSIYRAGYGTGSLTRFHNDMRCNHYVDLEQIKDIERDNPYAHRDVLFTTFAANFRSGNVKRPRGRLPFREHNEPWLMMGLREYSILKCRLGDLHAREQLASWLALRDMEAGTGETPAQIAARVVIRRRRLAISVGTLQNKSSAFRRRWGTSLSRHEDLYAETARTSNRSKFKLPRRGRRVKLSGDRC
ncbi:hypothetical protein [Sphingomonas montana]|uniref:hypothetical protein n=1 Tax=Sphingomonas montana TaxID=1843236 RepID=UPI00101AE1F7|nr:hypothetical protein [Sphingomonas montana]